MDCVYCKKEIIESKRKKRYCSKECSTKDWMKKNPNYKREHFKKNKEKYKILKKLRRLKIKNKEEYKKKNIEYAKKYRKKYPNKIKAHNLANYMIKIPKNKICEYCKERRSIEKHHPDYSKPLEIKFLCRVCHKKIHKERELVG